MLKIIPHFIYNQYKNKELEGHFQAVAVFVDIAGFTLLTGKAMKMGKEGAEIISDIINQVYTPLIDKVNRAGGFVSVFAGDSFTALFPDGKPDLIRKIALEMLKDIKYLREKPQENRYLSDLNVRIGIDWGKVDWGIVGKVCKMFYFKGQPILESAKAIKSIEPGEIAVFSRNSEQYPVQHKDDFKISSEVTDEVIYREFISEDIPEYETAGEFRDVCAVFTSFVDFEKHEEIDQFVSTAIADSVSVGGYFNGLFFDDKGPHLLTLFGAPKSYENNPKRALDFALKLKRSFGQRVKSGLSTGVAYVGVVGSRSRCTYTAIGDKVNLAARLMSHGNRGDIIISRELQKRTSNFYKTSERSSLSIKGVESPVTAYVIISEADSGKKKLFEGKTVGREEELAELVQLCKPIFESIPGGVVYVYGEAGIGKSRLIYDLTQRLSSTEVITLQADSIVRKSMNPFVYGLKKYFQQSDNKNKTENREIFEEVLNSLISNLELNSKDEKYQKSIEELIRVKSVLAAMVGLSLKHSLYEELDAEGKFNNTIFAIKELFKAMSILQPVILILEDLQWIDEDSKKVFSVLTRNLDGYPIIIITTSRLNDDGSKSVLNVDEGIKQVEINLENLKPDSTRTLIVSHIGNTVGYKEGEFILKQTGGNPFYVEQFCRYLVENELLILAGDEYHLISEDIDIPTGIREILVARIDRLSDKLKNIIRTASVLGREFEVNILSQMMKMLYKDSINRDYPMLLKKGEDEAIWSAVSEIFYIFKHALLRDTVYDMQLRKRLRELHKTAALALTDFYGEDETRYADIAFHFEKAQIKDQAVCFLRKAAEYAKREYKNDQYLKHCQHLLQYAENDEEKYNLNFIIAGIIKINGKIDKAMEIYKTVINFAESTNNLELWSKCLNKLGWISLSRGIPDDAMGKFKKALKLSEKINDLEGISQSLSNMASVSIHIGEYENALVMLSQCRGIAEKIKNTERFAYTLQLTGKIYTRLSNLKKGIEYYQEFLKISKEAGLKQNLCIGLSLLGLNTEEMGDTEKAMSLYNKAIETAKEIGSKYELARSYNNLALLYENQGNYSKSLKFYKLSYDMLLEIGNIRSALISRINLGLIYGKLGNLDRAFDILSEVLTQHSRLDEQNRAFALAYMGTLYKYKDDFNSAVEYFQKAEDIARNIKLPSLALEFKYHKIEVMIELKNFDEAREDIKTGLESYEGISNDKVKVLLQIFDAEVTAHYNYTEGVGKMISVIEGLTSAGDLAEAYFRLFRITGEDDHRKKAIKYREELISHFPDYYSKKILEFLKKK